MKSLFYSYQYHEAIASRRIVQSNEWWKMFSNLRFTPSPTHVNKDGVFAFFTVEVAPEHLKTLGDFLLALKRATIVFEGARNAFDIIMPKVGTLFTQKSFDCLLDVCAHGAPMMTDVGDRIFIFPLETPFPYFQTFNFAMCIVLGGQTLQRVYIVQNVVAPRVFSRMYFVSKV